MIRRLLLTLVLAVQFVAVASVSVRPVPTPGCGPCDPLEDPPSR